MFNSDTFNNLLEADWLQACADLDSLSGNADLFYILNHPEEFDTHTNSLAEFINFWDCHRQTN